MAVILIPLRNDIFFYSFRKELEGTVYTFEVRYNLRINSWLLSIPDQVINIRLAGGTDLLSQFKHLDVPPGELRIIDLDGMNTEPDKTNLGDRVILRYTETE